MALSRLTKQECIDALSRDLHAKISADLNAKEMRYDYNLIISHYVNRITDSIVLGNYQLTVPGMENDDKVWIEHVEDDRAGEGGDFSKKELVNVIAEFYNQNF